MAAAADDGEAAVEVGADNGAHRLRFGDAGLSSGSKSRVLFRVAPHAMASGSRGAGLGWGRRGVTGGERARAERGPEGRLSRGLRSSQAGRGEPPPPLPPRQGQWPGQTRARAGGAGGSARRPRQWGALPPLQTRLPRERLRPPPPSVQAFAPRLSRSGAETCFLRKSIPAPWGVRPRRSS